MSSSVRHLLLLLVLISICGTGAELLLLGHFESATQWIPLVLTAGALPVVVWHWARPSAATVRVFAATMAVFALAGLAGLLLHYRGNVAFELEMHPTMKGWSLFWESIRGATPALAPAIMIYTGLLGIVCSLFHPSESNKSCPE